MDYPLFETERLLLRLTNTEDCSFVLQLFNSPKWLRYIGDRKIYSKEDANDYICKRMLAEYERLGFSTYTVIRKSDLVKMGICGLYDREGVDGIDIGFAFLPKFEGRGYAFEATEKLKELAFSKFGLSELMAVTNRFNFASQKLLRKLGMEQLCSFYLPGDKEKLLLYHVSKT